MMERRRRTASALCAALAAALGGEAASAQTAPPRETAPMTICNYAALDTDNGLSCNSVNVVFCDASGLLWVGTDDGLNSNDGYNIRHYKPRGLDSTAIAGKQILDICEFSPNAITLALGDGNICTFDKLRGTFSRSGRDTGGLSGAQGMCRMGRSVFAVFGSSVFRRDLATGNTMRIALPCRVASDSGRRRRAKMLPMPGERGRMAIHTGPHSVCLMDTWTDSIAETRLPGVHIYDICALDATRLLLATRDGLLTYDLDAGTLLPSGLLSGEIVYSLTRNAASDIWVAYGDGRLLLWRPSENSVTRVANSQEILKSGTRVNAMHEDANGLLWVATANGGIIKLDTKRPKVATLHAEAPLLPQDYRTYDVGASSDSSVWAACGHDGVVRVGLRGGKASVFRLGDEKALSVLPRKDGTVLIGTAARLLRLAPATGAVEAIDLECLGGDTAAAVTSMSEDCLGNVWLSTRRGLLRYNGRHFERFGAGVPASAYCSVEDAEGRIWAGTSRGILVRQAGESTPATAGRSGAKRVGDILCLAEHGDKMLAGTPDGVAVFDKQTLAEEPPGIFSPFAGTTVHSIAVDPNGIVWLYTSTGVGYVDTNYGNTYLFGDGDGLSGNGDERHKFVRIGGTIYFGRPTELNMIDTRHVTFNTRIPTTFVSEVAYGRSGRESTTTMRDDSTFVIRYRSNASTRISLASSDYTRPRRNQFMYRLDDNEWIDLGNSHEVILPGLLPGLYRLRLRSSNADKTWSYDVKTVYLDVVAPLWMSTPALVFYGVGLLAAAWFTLNLRVRRMSHKMRQAQSELKAKSSLEAQRNRLANVIDEQRASLNYAKRIQDALMPPVQGMESLMGKFFVLYRPRDIIGGDFYTFYHRDGLSFIISADCEGHGVPGALISILGMDQMNNIVMRQRIDDPGEILTTLHEELLRAVTDRVGTGERVNDGMDVTVCVVHHAERRIEFAGAMNDLYIIRDNTVLVFRGKRQSVAQDLSMDNSHPATVFESESIECRPGDMMYLFSDGYCDQFGGPEDKKFKKTRFRNLLLNIHKLPANDQKLMLNQKLLEWMGGRMQYDDVSVIGFEPWPDETAQ